MDTPPTTTGASNNPLDNYESLEVIGTGSFGTIRKVRRKSDGQIFARKELNFERMTERDRKQIVAEVNILKDLDHEHIVRYHDRFVDRDNGILYIVMEYCGGGDLAAIIQRCRREGTMLPEDTIWAYFLQIVIALHQCHHPGLRVHTGTTPPPASASDDRRAQVLHRDIKPENVFLNGDNVVKLGDFGLSKQLAGAGLASTYVGTPYYMSPEVMQEKPYDSKSDIWSLGCLLYELCALNPPFHEARTHNELAHFIRNGRIPPLPRAYSSALAQVIKAMLNVNPAMRPSAQQLLQHERLDLAFKLANMEKMVKQVKHMKLALQAKEAELEARAREMEARDEQRLASFQAFLLQKENEVRGAMEARERELQEAMLMREREMCEAVLRREDELKVKWEQREEEIKVAWEARERELSSELCRREELLRKEEERLAERLELEAQGGKERKKPLEELKNLNFLHRHESKPSLSVPKTPVSRFAAKSSATLALDSPGSAMQGVVLTTTGEVLPTPPPKHHAVPESKDLAKLLQASPVVGLDFAKFGREEEEGHSRPSSPCPTPEEKEKERPTLRARKISAVNIAAGRSSLPVPVATSSTVPTTAKPTADRPDKEKENKPRPSASSKLSPAAVYDLADEENLPSPFIKRSLHPGGAPVANRAAPARPTLTKRPSGVGVGATVKARPSIVRAKMASEDARKALRTGTA
ncbi:Pkinase-domain-containing protein [Exidia glandulosa HHB12029]|uniref:non-specific serine/threonine protein kinase n=1 Tax=Exidia glandulosa HHB12029 TaxID=1314781 RepID=A0A165P8C8_EXIGL|nr:Pkinase-domain-containing protein [Exidia glandulosa HHB12029]